MKKLNRKDKIKASTLAILFHIVIFLILFFFVISTPIPAFEEVGGSGIEVNLGYSDDGSGEIQQYTSTNINKNSKENNRQLKDNTEDEDNITSNDPDAPEVEATKKKNKNKDKKIKITEETKDIKKNEPEVKINVPTVNPMALYKKKGSGDGITGKSGDQGKSNGNPNSTNYNGNGGNGSGNGSGTGNGNGSGNGVGWTSGTGVSKDGAVAYKLKDRKARNFPKISIARLNQKETVVVTIRVNREGKVIMAESGAKGTTTSDTYLRNIAEDAAKKITFDAKSDAPEIQVGTITVNFIPTTN